MGESLGTRKAYCSENWDYLYQKLVCFQHTTDFSCCIMFYGLSVQSILSAEVKEGWNETPKDVPDTQPSTKPQIAKELSHRIHGQP